jgi:leader peptidase (prepilin peptidase)/N-methyltransferase
MTTDVPNTMIVVGMAVFAGVATFWLVRATQHHPRRWRAGERAAVVAGAGLLAAAVTTLDGGYGLVPFAVLGGAAAIVDVIELRLPDLLTGSLAAGTVLLVSVDGLITRSAEGLGRAVVTAAGVLVAALLAKLIRTSLLGWGDTKFLISLAAVLGWWNRPAILTAALLWAALIVVTSALVSALRIDRRDVPYGPALLLGTLGALAVTG